MSQNNLPELPPPVSNAVARAAYDIAAALEAAGLPMLGHHKEPSVYLYSIIYLFKKQCKQAAEAGETSVDLLPSDEMHDILVDLTAGEPAAHSPRVNAARRAVSEALAELEVATETRVRAYHKLEKARLRLAELLDK